MTRSRDARRRALEPDEHALWSKMMADVKPLRRARPPKPVTPAALEPVAETRQRIADAERPKTVTRASPPSAPVATARPVAPPRQLNALGIDKSTLARLKRGDLAIDGRLDLHGMTQADAHETLDRFVDGGVGRGARLLLVITGKGAGGDGVLRAMLPRWLRAGPHATRILRIEPAHVKHGGSGAWYVYLRRRRDTPS
ncbi:MAG: Smr/MutS family protein [Alphaproteobacteria bacterium]|nr:Smr/MutS family protein [Alphaproteobacteria bacterium]